MKTNNYKIIEDRPELAADQVMAGMSFGMIQKKVPASKTSSLNILIAVGIAAAVVVSAVFIYRAFSNTPKSKKEQRVINDTIKENKISTIADTVVAEEKIEKGKKTLANHSIKAYKNESSINQAEIEASKYYQPKRCVLLIPSYCCYCIPGTYKFAVYVDTSDAKIGRMDCESLYQMKDVCCIWLTIQVKDSSYLKLEDQLNNFALLKGKDKELHPFAIKVSNDPKLWMVYIKGKAIKVKYNKEMNVLLFFKDSKAKVGGKVRINKLIATITR